MIGWKQKSILVCIELVIAGSAAAQQFPAKPVRIVVGFAAGGSTDKLARVLATRMSELLGQSVVVDNRPGAAGNLAAEMVATAAPDGYTIFMATLSSQAINPHLYKLKFDPIKSFEPIALVAKYPLLLVVPPPAWSAPSLRRPYARSSLRWALTSRRRPPRNCKQSSRVI